MTERGAQLDRRDIRIRPPAGAAELEACAWMMAESDPWRTLGRGLEDGRRLLQRPDRETWVAVDGDEVVGFVILCLTGGFVGYLQTIAVRADRRSRGVGRQLMAFAEERIFREFPNVFICVSSFNPRARALYDALGYEVVGCIRDFIVAGHDEWLLRKTRGPMAGWPPHNPGAPSAA